MEKKTQTTPDTQDVPNDQVQEHGAFPEGDGYPSLKELDRRVPGLPHEESDDAWA